MEEELSEREKQVAAHFAAGLRPPGVARELGIAEVTVRNHLSRIFAKLGVHSQSEMIERLRERPALMSGADSRIGMSRFSTARSTSSSSSTRDASLTPPMPR